MTMDPFAQAQAPAQGPVSLDDAFVDGFTQMAYSAFEKVAPSLVPRIVTFRVLDVDAQSGSGLGAFVLDLNDDTFYVPAVVAENDVKKLSIFYSPRTDRYYPLTSEWLAEANRSAPPSLGESVDPPRSLQSDVDVSAAVRPPIVGRYGFASERRAGLASRAAGGSLDAEVKRAFMSALAYRPRPKEASYPRALRALPPRVKVAYRELLARRPATLQKLARLYTVNAIVDALAAPPAPAPAAPRAKTAAEGELRLKRDVFVATAGTPVQKYKDGLGADAGRAYSIARQWGYFARDLRPGTDRVVRFDPTTLNLTQPGLPGIYNVFLADGTAAEVLVVFNDDPMEERRLAPGVTSINARADDRARHVVVLFKDGKTVETRATFVAEPVLTSDAADFAAIVHAWTKDAPKVGERGFFVSAARGTPLSVGPFQFKSMSSFRGATTYLQEWGPSVVVNATLGPGTRLRSNVAGQGNVMISPDYRWFAATSELGDEPVLMRSPAEVERAIEAKFAETGGVPVDVKVAADGRFVVGRGSPSVGLAEAVEKVARDYNVALPAALDVLAHAAAGTRARHWVKRAADDTKKKSKGDGGGGGAPAEDPSMGDPSMMDPAMMDPSMMAPPPPDGYELAIAEQLQLIQNQIAALNDKAQTLSMLQNRKLQIEGGGGMIAAPTGAASLLAGAPMGPDGGPAMAPPYADPSGMGAQGGMAPQGMPPGMDPAMTQGGMPPGMDPAMMQGGMAPQGMAPQGMPPGMDPVMMQGDMAPPRAVMTDAALDAGALEAAVNPDFLDRAAELDQADVFDAAAIASLAQNRTLRPLVQSYVPNAEETLDNVARLKLNFDLKEGLLKKELGNTEYTEMRQTLDDTFEALGALLLKLHRTTDPVGPSSPAPRQA